MFFRHTHGRADWWAPGYQRLCGGLIEAMGWLPHLRRDATFFEDGFWHPTRLVEYPWTLHVRPPTGRVLDIGSNAQFHVALLGMGADVTAHYTTQDLDHLSLMNCFRQGWHTVEPAYTRYPRRINWVLGYPDRLPLAEGSFETIYCLSVIEHVERDRVAAWMDAMWRWLKPGGRLVFTADYLLDFALGDGLEGHFWNHDLGAHLRQWGATPDHCAADELPWAPGFTVPAWDDLLVVHAEPAGQPVRVGVYGFTVSKE
jgi:SAM-dependent methyltransferase